MSFANQNIQAMDTYSPPLDGRTKYNGFLFDFNERTIPPSKKVLTAIQNYISQGKLNRYPEYFDFCERIANYASIKNEEVMITNGSDQGIDLIFRTFTEKNDEIIIPSPSFTMFYQCAYIQGNRILKIPYRETDPAFPFEEILEATTERTKLIVLCNPNNPTGTLIPFEQIEAIVQKAKNAIVYVDEAYYEFSGITAAPLIEKYPNLIITRTFSKAFGLAALRIGYVLSQKQNIREMMKVRGPYDINTLAYIAGKAALEDEEDLSSYTTEVMFKAKPKLEKFFAEKDIPFFESAANFLLFKPKNWNNIFEALRKNGFLLRPQSQKGIQNTLRVTIGTEEETTELLCTFSEIL